MTTASKRHLDDKEIQGQVEDELGLYVYMLVDPRTETPFYVGKGRGLRWRSHEWAFPEPSDDVADQEELNRKNQRISSIQSEGLHPETWILRYGMNASEYTAVEAATIDLLSTFAIAPRKTGISPVLPLGLLAKGNERPLVNERREAARGHGIRLLTEIYDELAAPLLTNRTPMLMIKLGGWVDEPGKVADGGSREGHGYKHEWLVSKIRDQHLQELGESVRGDWNIAEWRFDEANPDRVRYLVAVHRGVTRGLFEIEPGSFTYSENPRRKSLNVEPLREGELWNDVVGPHGHIVPGIGKGTQNPVFYWPR